MMKVMKSWKRSRYVGKQNEETRHSYLEDDELKKLFPLFMVSVKLSILYLEEEEELLELEK